VLALPELPDIHGDPFDRMLVAQALVEDMTIVTGDQAIAQYPVPTIW
jgi:PIN domain nuclease of toxin-antitoxin system